MVAKITPQQTLPEELAGAKYPAIDAISQRMSDHIKPLAEVEREAIEQAIKVCRGNIPKAAALLDVAPSTLYRKLASW